MALSSLSLPGTHKTLSLQANQPAETRWWWLGRVAAMACVAIGIQASSSRAASLGFETNGTCVGSCLALDPLSLGSGPVTLPVYFNTTLPNGDIFQISGSPYSSNQGSPGYKSSFSVEYLGNTQRNGLSQDDQITTTIFRSWATNSVNPVNFSTNHSAVFSQNIASGSIVSALDASNQVNVANYGSASSPQSFSATRPYQVTPISGELPLDFTFNSVFANGSPVGSYISWNGAGSPPPSSPLPTFSVELERLVPLIGDQAISVLATASDASGSISLGTAAKELGVNHFNWIQMLVSDPDLIACSNKSFPTGSLLCNGITNISGKVPANGTLDPPLGGWAYQKSWRGRNNSFPSADFNPFYWDESFPSNNNTFPLLNPTFKDYQFTVGNLASLAYPAGVQTNDLNFANGYGFYDRPGQGNPGTSRFVDFLVGVKGTCGTITYNAQSCAYIPIPGTEFTWSSTNGMIISNQNETVDATMIAAALNPLGCSDPICGQAISLSDALSLTGETLLSFESLGNSDVTIPEPSSCRLITAFLGILAIGRILAEFHIFRNQQ